MDGFKIIISLIVIVMMMIIIIILIVPTYSYVNDDIRVFTG